MTDEDPPPPTDFPTILAKVTNLSSDNNDDDDDNLFLYMPAEWTNHSACLILFPHNIGTFRVEKASKEIINLAFLIATVGREAVYLLCKDESDAKTVSKQVEAEKSRRRCSSKNKTDDSNNNNSDHIPIYVDVCPSQDTWSRDTAPIFVWQQRGKKTTQEKENMGHLIGLDWDFNAYGGPDEGCYWPCTDDRKIARNICNSNNNNNSLSLKLNINKSISIPMILEGGSVHTDGEGTLLTTSECLNNPNRNPHLSQSEIETILIHALGVTKVLWLPHGLDADEVRRSVTILHTDSLRVSM
jgi:agmatine/peptidylarginine deiminase